MTNSTERPLGDVSGGAAPLWRNRNFMLLWGAQSVSELGSSITQLAIPLAAVVLLDATPVQVGLLTAMVTLPYLLVALQAGAIVDRRAKRPLMVWCAMGRVLLIGSIPVTTIPSLGLELTYVHLLSVALLSGVLTVFFDIAYQSFLPVLLDKDELVDGNGKLGTTSAFAQFAGPSIGGVLIGLVGAARALTMDAFTFVLSALALCLMRQPEPEPTPTPRAAGRKMRHEIAEGLSFVVRHPVLRAITASSATANLFGSVFMSMSVVYLVRTLEVEPRYIGAIWSVAAVGGMIGGALTDRLTRRVGVERVIWMAPLVLGLPMFLQPLAQPGWSVALYSVGYFFYSLYAVVFNVAQRSYRQAITPAALVGRMNASVRFLVMGTIPLGAALGGLSGSYLGVRQTIWVGVAGAWLSGLWLFFSPLRRGGDLGESDGLEPRDASVASVDLAP